MRPELNSTNLLSITRAKAKMFEYDVATQYHIKIPRDPSRLLILTIGLIGDLASQMNAEDQDRVKIAELQRNIHFAAYFFDAYCQSKLQHNLDSYLLLVGSAAYYLCNLPGSSSVLISHLSEEGLDLECEGLENLMLWLLKGDFSSLIGTEEGIYKKHIKSISNWMASYWQKGIGEERLLRAVRQLREYSYVNGSHRQLFFADVICALVKKRLENSTWYCLPRYSGLAVDKWAATLEKETFIHELWPAQHLLGKKGVYSGTSAVVQMPTSAGKTKATDIIIRSAFLSQRTSLAVIVAPFRALCHEIKNSLVKSFQHEPVAVDELSDVLQIDFTVDSLLVGQQIIVVTPEKLLYALRHTPELAKKIGLIIYDEGHQFDSEARGVTYELLLTSLKALVPSTVQAVLVSAVITNADSINKWLNLSNAETAMVQYLEERPPVVITGRHLNPTYRTVAFTSWLDQLGRLEFVTEGEPDKEEFFVPRVIESHTLQLLDRERKTRMFPEKEDGQSVALYLGLKLASKGCVAIFCGTKATASKLCEKALYAFNRGLPVESPAAFSDKTEIELIYSLYKDNLGENAIATHSARIGIFAHHANTPHGLRLAVEHAIRDGLVKFVVCTSTLAQGVNLPIRYLIVTSVYQGREKIKVRDFHNLIGRTGRSGMYTEGSILFADPEVYDKRRVRRENWRWRQVKELLDPGKAEPCQSMLLKILEPLKSDSGDQEITMGPMELVQTYLNTPDRLVSLSAEIASQYSSIGFSESGLRKQIARKIIIISAIESYLMAHWDDSESGMSDEHIVELVHGTLAHYLADEKDREHLIQLFKMLAVNISQKVSEPSRRVVFGRTLYGLRDSIEIEDWVKQNIDDISSCDSQEDMLSILWPALSKHIRNATFRKCNPASVLISIALEWIQGTPFYQLFEIMKKAGARIGEGDRHRQLLIEHVVDICENAVAFDGMLALGAITEVYGLMRPKNKATLKQLNKLQKRLKYGLASSSAIFFYEIGFSDRVISTELSATLKIHSYKRETALIEIKQQKNEVRACLKQYPIYFMHVAEQIFDKL